MSEERKIGITTLVGRGRIQIPSELRREKDWETGDKLLWSIDEEGNIVVEKV